MSLTNRSNSTKKCIFEFSLFFVILRFSSRNFIFLSLLTFDTSKFLFVWLYYTILFFFRSKFDDDSYFVLKKLNCKIKSSIQKISRKVIITWKIKNFIITKISNILSCYNVNQTTRKTKKIFKKKNKKK